MGGERREGRGERRKQERRVGGKEGRGKKEERGRRGEWRGKSEGDGPPNTDSWIRPCCSASSSSDITTLCQSYGVQKMQAIDTLTA